VKLCIDCFNPLEHEEEDQDRCDACEEQRYWDLLDESMDGEGIDPYDFTADADD